MPETTVTRDDHDLVLVVDDREIGRYRAADDGIDPIHTPKPYFHPLRTLGGEVLTGFAPEDHPWHHGLQFAFPRVGDHNLWGGGTYLGPDLGYVVLDDQGAIRHEEWLDDTEPGRFGHRVTWRGHGGEVLIDETRRHALARVDAGRASGWMLQLETRLRNATADELRLETPAQRGREDGGYGGWFLRFAEGFAATDLSGDGRPVEASGVRADTFVVHGRTAEGGEVTVGMGYGPGSSPGTRTWLYRFEPFPLAGFAVAYDDGLAIAAGEALSFSHRIACFDGWIDPAEVAEILAR